jgi:hypothetical protein
MTQPVAVEFEAEVKQVKTMMDHTINVTLCLPEYAVEQATWFLRNQGLLVGIVAVLKPSEE